MSKYFDLSRFWLLMKLELARCRKGLLMILAIIFGLQFFVSLLLEPVIESSLVFDSHDSNYAFGLLICGFILSSLAFNELGDTLKRYAYLTLPVSTFEKFFCMWLLTGFGWIIFFTIISIGYTWIANLIGSTLFNHITFLSFDPFSDFSITTIKYYFVLHGIFLVGAVHFKGYVFPKTIFTLIVILTISGVIFYFLAHDLFRYEHECTGYQCEIVTKAQSNTAWIVTYTIFWWGFAPLCWILTYLGLKEKEI